MEKIEKVGSHAEYDPARVVLVHTPNIEYSEGMLCPSAALYEGYGSPEIAKQEHLDYILELRRRDIQVYNLVDVLLDGSDEKEHGENNKDIRLLRELALNSLSYSFENLSIENKERLNLEKRIVIGLSSPAELVRIILLQSTEEISPTSKNTGYKSRSVRDPLYNLMFTRDQMITTDKGVVLGKMNSEQRASEVNIMKVVLEKLGITPIYEIQECVLEGGDFIPCGKDKHEKTFAMIGQGLRTNETAIEEIINRNGKEIFGFDYVAVIKDQKKSQDEMHLDTYFNVFAPLKAIVLETRIGDRENQSNENEPKVDIYEKTSSGSYKKIQSDIKFRDFLTNAGFEVTRLTEEMQRKYGCNLLTISANHIIGVDISAKADYEAKLKVLEDRLKGMITDSSAMIRRYYHELGIRYRTLMSTKAGLNEFGLKLMPFTHLNKAYGGPHCLTQVLYRESQR